MAAAVLPSRSRIATLEKLRCAIFQTSYNPTSVRTGAKYLRARLRGPSMLTYYPQYLLSTAKINAMVPGLHVEDENENQRFIDIDERKARGKGAPKKLKSAAESRRTKRRK